MESTGTLRHSLWNAVFEKKKKSQNQLIGKKHNSPKLTCIQVEEKKCPRKAKGTFIHTEVKVFIIVEQDLFLVRPGHSDDLIPQSLWTNV